jgi:hypothetical protein
MVGSGWGSSGAGTIQAGADLWSSCATYGTGMPTFAVNGFGTISITIDHVAGSGGVACSNFQPSTNQATGKIIGGTITTYDSSDVVANCDSIRSETLAHKLGHVLGLGHTSCSGYIMGPPNVPRSVQADECSQVDQQWTTPTENPPPAGGGGGGGGGYDIDPGGGGYNEDLPCFPGIDAWCSPIVINFENGDYRLTGKNAPVLFDIRGDGHPLLMGWTAAGADEAFLWLDRNHNGRVTSGAELFGNFTPLQNGHLAKNGFEALAEFDANHDGVIDDHDPIWPRLQLWRDLNHNGISEPSEISQIDASGVTAIDLHDHWTGRHDQWGNDFRYESLISISNRSGHGGRKQPVYDIFFVSVAK